MNDIELAKNDDLNRYEVHVDGKLAGFADYRVRNSGVAFTHTEVSPEYGGRGLGSKLAKFGLDDVRAMGTHAIPFCPFISAYIRERPEYLDLVEESRRPTFSL